MASAAKKVVDFFASVRLTITLLIIITVVSVFGVIIPQGLPAGQYLHKWGASWGNGLLLIGIDHVFSTIWFFLLLGLFSCNIFVCSMTRLWRNIGNSLRKSFLPSKNAVELCRHSTSFSVKTNSAATKDAVEKQLLHRRFAVKTQPQGEGFQIVARKGVIKDIGSLLFHMSIIVLFIGGFIGSRFGYSVTRNLSAGQVATVPNRDFLLRCDWFKLEQNEDGSPKEYTSKLSILSRKDSSVILDKIIKVNIPLSYQGIRFYQSSYGLDDEGVKNVAVTITGPGLPETGWNGAIPYNKPFVLPGAAITALAFNYLPDFIIDMETKQASTRSSEPNNPAVKIILLKGKDTLYDHWAFFNFPDQHAGNGPYKVAPASYEPSYYTGIQVRDNPGIPAIWVGIILMTFGIFAVFYIPKKSMWVYIEPRPDAKNGSAVAIGGTSNRAPSDFQGEFDKFAKQLQTTLKQEP
jgi:cytochrome c biogenesis protein